MTVRYGVVSRTTQQHLSCGDGSGGFTLLMGLEEGRQASID